MAKVKFLILTSIVLLLLSACSTKAAVTMDLENAPEYQVFITKDDNFIVKTYIDKLEFSDREEINFYSTIEYVGKEKSISVYSGDPYFNYLIHDGKDYINSGLTHDVLKETIFRKGEIYKIPFSKSGGYSQEDPNVEFLKKYFSEAELRLPKGEYTFTAATGFYLDNKLSSNVALKNEFTIIVK